MSNKLQRTGRRWLAAAAGAATVALGLAMTVSAPSSATAAVPTPDHVIVVVFENTEAGQVYGNASAPYFNQLASTGAKFTDSFAITHPSQPNYLDLFSGSAQGVTDDSCPHTFSTDNVAAELLAKGLTWGSYSEDLPAVGSTVCTSGNYARKHNPWTNFTNVPATANMPLTSFPTDFTQLPTVSWVIPNLCDDIHNCSIATGDTWLKTHLDAYVQWAKTHNSLLITTFDEDDSAGNNNILTLFNGQPVQPGTYSETINHYSVLRTVEDMYGLPYAGAAASTTPITDVWGSGTTTTTTPTTTTTVPPTTTTTVPPTTTTTPADTVTVTDPGAQKSTVSKAITSLQIQATDSASAPLTFTASGLPAGLSISSSGLISGTPTTKQTATVTVTASSATASASTSFTWTVSRH